MYKVSLTIGLMVFGEWRSNSISELLGDYLVISQIWHEATPFGLFPNVDMEVAA